MNRILAALVVFVFIGLMVLYVREFPVFDNTIGIKILIFGSLAVGLILSIALLILLRKRLVPLDNHLPEIFSIVFAFLIFSPLFGSLFNRLGASESVERSFIFEQEKPFKMGGFGWTTFIQNRPTAMGWQLFVNDGERKRYRFRYEKQAYFPLTKSGEVILLPLKTGLFGFPIIDLK